MLAMQELPSEPESSPSQETEPGSPAELELAVPSMERLRDGVSRVVEELNRLRLANVELHERIKLLEETGGLSGRAVPLLGLEDDPEIVREKITRFIQAIDRYLEEVDEPGAEGE